MDYKNKQGRALKIDSDYTLMASVIFITYLISIRCKDSCRHSLITFKARRTSESEEDELYLYQIFSVSLPNCKPSESNRGSVPFAFMPLNCQLSTTSPPLLSSHLDVYHTIKDENISSQDHSLRETEKENRFTNKYNCTYLTTDPLMKQFLTESCTIQ
ncbi:hypothetical protein YC2023_038807 [Brassica napus]